MAVDTATKRASALTFGFPFAIILPVPDGAVGQADRQHLLADYGGILAAGGVLPPLRHAAYVTTDLGHASRVTLDLSHASTITEDLVHESSIEARY